MSRSQIWLPLMEVMARSCDVVLLVDQDFQICEVVSMMTSSSDLVAVDARGTALSTCVSSVDLGLLDASDADPQRPQEAQITVRDPHGRRRNCHCTVVSLPVGMQHSALRLIMLNDVGGARRSADALSHQALHDQLTGLLNRAAFFDRLDHSMMGGDRVTDPVVVIFIDLDDFKPINDRFGHEVGDHMLALIGGRISAVASRSDTVARLGGDEFAILIDHREASGAQDHLGRGIDVAQRVIEAVTEPLNVAGVTAHISASIGIAVAGSESTTSSLLHDADLAMYEAKRSGKGQIRVFDPAMRQRASVQVEYRRELPLAIEREQLAVVYLPHFDLCTGEVLGWEALVRWEHPELGAIEPDEFVPIAERAGLMGEIGRWVRRTAVDYFVASLSGSGGREIFLALNVSVSELRAATGAAVILADLNAGGISPQSVVIEISEQVINLADPSLMSVISDLRTAGIRIALDDVGGLQSSVSLLHEAPVDIVKLSPEVVATAPIGPSGLAASFIDLCRRRDVRVIAEGVETEEQKLAVVELGCQIGHGRWLGAPMIQSQSPPQ
jgi:diguanylate cyclase (GGDEF)-like protein